MQIVILEDFPGNGGGMRKCGGGGWAVSGKLEQIKGELSGNLPWWANRT